MMTDLDAAAYPDKMNPMTGGKNGRADALRSALFWGSLWGIWEATIGHLIHLIRIPGLPGVIMFPAAFYFMSRAFAASGKPASIFLTACVAASIKLLNLFFPGRDVFSVLNPAQAILLESLAVIGIFSFLRTAGRISLSVPVLASLAWRITHCVLNIFMASAFAAPSLFEIGTLSVLRFLLIDGLSNGFLIFLMIWAERSRWKVPVEYIHERTSFNQEKA